MSVVALLAHVHMMPVMHAHTHDAWPAGRPPDDPPNNDICCCWLHAAMLAMQRSQHRRQPEKVRVGRDGAAIGS